MPGPHRPDTLGDQARAALLRDARRHGAATERHRQAMLTAAEKRQDTILALHEGGMSVRELAASLGVTGRVIQDAISRARARVAAR